MSVLSDSPKIRLSGSVEKEFAGNFSSLGQDKEREKGCEHDERTHAHIDTLTQTPTYADTQALAQNRKCTVSYPRGVLLHTLTTKGKHVHYTPPPPPPHTHIHNTCPCWYRLQQQEQAASSNSISSIKSRSKSTTTIKSQRKECITW